MSNQCTLTRTQAPRRNYFQFWEQQLFAQKRKSVGEFDGLDLEDAKKLQQAADEIVAHLVNHLALAFERRWNG
ncbi:uncharacterized protein Bfra_011609 [Botrytis fragariae]|uniref:Uncharacterized protein n=1 Tax=Botrytis fragariae TaxID=1964551 RepID=A0A8H6AKE1_9HELO|nr:uncharacterized protein Bfra_011609 [Botrytis fragariae]KAF5869067.1 hypothetical protein Bfra_011609 [Botrytis fragariae]